MAGKKEQYILHDGFVLKKANPLAFGIHETIYSNMDLELSFSWKKRTRNNVDCDDLFWIYNGTNRVGGVHISPNLSGSFFMETPNVVDRYRVISAINCTLLEWSDKDKGIKIYGVISSDVKYFQNLGYQIKSERRVMIRPTEIFEDIDWHNDYTIKVPRVSDAPDLGELFFDSYSGGIQYEVLGQQSLEEATSGAESLLNIYKSNNTLDGSILVYDKSTNQLIASCIAGISGFCDNDFSEIGDIVVDPKYRKLGLASHMIKHTLTNLKKISPATILCVTIGNPAENLYEKMGFFSGIKFTNMYLNK